MKRFFTLAIILLTCADYGSAQVNNYVIDPTFNTEDYYTKGRMHGFLYREDFQDIYVNFNRSSDVSDIDEQSIVDLNGNFLYNAATNYGGTPYLYRNGILAARYGGVIYRILPPHPDAGVDSELFFFEYSKDMYDFPGRTNLNGDLLILPDSTILMAGRFAADSINPGIQGYRHLVRIDSSGNAVESFPEIVCEPEPWSTQAYDIHPGNNGKYWFVGDFAGINGHQTNYVAQLNADFTVDTTYVSPFIENDGWGSLIDIDSGGNLWIGCGVGCNIASGPLEDRTLIKLTSEGEIDGNFNIPDAYSYFNDESVFRMIPSIAFEDTDGNFIMGNNIMLYNGVTVKRIFKITPNGDLIQEAFENLGADEAEWDGWTFDQEYAEVMVNRILRQPDGKLLIGGAFSSFGGEPYSCMVRLEQDGFVSTENRERDDFGIHVWPNPAKTFVKWNKEVESVALVNALGQTVLEKTTEGSLRQINLPILPEGLYTLVFRKNNQSTSKKLFIQQR
jgi:hypothetical protein